MQPPYAHPHYHVTANLDDGTSTDVVEGAYLPALATARRLVDEAQQPGGRVLFDAMAGELPFCAALWVVYGASGAAVASVSVSGACYGHHQAAAPAARTAATEVPAQLAA